MKKRLLQIDNNTITLYESKGTNQPAIMISGNTQSSESFYPQLSGRLGKKYRLIALNLPGHGKSARAANPNKTYCLPGYVELLRQVILRLEIDQPVLIGHSLGGHIALETSPDLPKLKGCFIFGTPPIGIPLSLDKAFHPISALSFCTKAYLSEAEMDDWVSAMVDGKEVKKCVMKMVRSTDPNTRELLGKSLANLNFRDELDIISKFYCPLAIIHAAKDQLVNLNYIRSLDIPSLWKGSVQVIPDVGHFPQLEAVEIFDEILTEFLDYLFEQPLN